jgi:WD40 repeat protein
VTDDAVEFGSGPVRRIGKGWPLSIRWSPDGTRIVAATTSGIYIYDGNTLAPIRHFFSPVQRRRIAISPDDRYIVSGDSQGQTKLIEVWDTTTGDWVRNLTDPSDPFTEPATDIVISPDGKTVTILGGQVIRQWTIDGTLLHKWYNTEDVMWGFSVSPDGARLAAVADRKGTLWDGHSDRLVATVDRTDHYAAPVFNPESTKVAFAGRDGNIQIAKADTGEVIGLLRIDGIPDFAASSMSISPNGKMLAAGVFWFNTPKTGPASGWTVGHAIALWNLDTGALVHLYPGEDTDGGQIAFTRDSRYIVRLNTRAERISVWNVLTQTLESVVDDYAAGDGYALGFDLSPDGMRLLTTGYGAFKIWDLGSGALLHATQRIEGYTSSAVYSPDGAQIAFGAGNDVMIRDAHSGRWLSTLRGHIEPPDRVVYSPDGTRLASASLDQTIRIWDVHAGTLIRTIQNPLPQLIGPGDYSFGRTNAPGIAYSPDGSLLASGSFDKVVRVWDTNDGRLLRTFGQHDDDVTSVAFSADGALLASSSKDKTVKIWGVNTGALLRTLGGHSGIVTSVVFSPDGTQVVSGSADDTIRVWNAQNGALLRTLSGHTGGVLSVAYGHQGNRIASSSADSTVRVWDAVSGKLLATGRSHTAAVESVSFNADDTELAGSSRLDGTIDLWRFQP